MSNFKKRLIALAATAALSAGSMVAVQSANAATGSNCNVKTKAAAASCDVLIYGALHRVTSLDATAPGTGGYT